MAPHHGIPPHSVLQEAFEQVLKSLQIEVKLLLKEISYVQLNMQEPIGKPCRLLQLISSHLAVQVKQEIR